MAIAKNSTYKLRHYLNTANTLVQNYSDSISIELLAKLEALAHKAMNTKSQSYKEFLVTFNRLENYTINKTKHRKASC